VGFSGELGPRCPAGVGEGGVGGMRCKISSVVGGPGEAVEDEFEVAGARVRDGGRGLALWCWGVRSRSWDCADLVGGVGVCKEAGERDLYLLVMGFWIGGF